MEGGEQNCALYSFNKSDPFHIGNTYGGIPTNLVTNAIGWTLLMIGFLLIRKSAFKFLKVKQLEKISSELDFMNKISQLFFSGNESVLTDTTRISGQENRLDTGQHRGSGDERESLSHHINNPEAIEDADADETRSNISTTTLDEDDSFWTWLVKVFKLTDHQLRIMAGDDAVQYLRFQRYVIGYIFITTVLSICVVLPLNFQGALQGNITDFGHTTLSNLNPESPYLWVHITIAFILFPIAIYLMRKFSAELKFRDPDLELTRTLCIENIPVHMCTEELLNRHFTEAYPGIEIHDIKVAYDVAILTQIYQEMQDVESGLEYSVRKREKHGKNLTMYPKCASRFCQCFCSPCSIKVNVEEYYREKLKELQADFVRQRENSLHSPLGMAFITLTSINNAKLIFDDHKKNFLINFSENQPLSTLSASMKPDKWKVWFAPPPKDIYWEHLSDKRNWLVLKIIVSNICLFLVTFFLTTPEYLVSQFDTILIAIFGPDVDFQNSTGSSWIQDFLPTVMLWSFTALLPLLVSYSDRWLGRWTRSEENHSIMRKTFWYLLFMVIVLPTFGFTTGMAYFNFLFRNNSTDTYKWECIFLPDSGAFFVNYVITAALIGSALELIRFPEMFWYMVQVCFSRTEAESPAIQRAVTYEFRFGEQYARMLLIFAMVMMYSVSCPLITPFGLLYFILKHLVDRHNLAFVYAPSKINKKVHASAINFVIMSVGLLQFFMVAFSILRSGKLDLMTERTKYALVLFVITINIFTAQIWSSFCRRLSPIKYEDVLYLEDGGDEDHLQPYLPTVLKEPERNIVYKIENPQEFQNTARSPVPSENGSGEYGTFHNNVVTID